MWNTLIVQPISWLLRTLYELTASYGIAIILFTIIMKIVFLPFAMKGKKSMIAVQRLNPKLKELEAKYKNDKEKYNLELQKLYKKEKVNPLSGCLWQLLPFPIIIALFDVVRRPLTNLMRLSGEQIEQIISHPAISESLTAKGINLATAAAQNQIPVANAIHENFDKLIVSLPEVASTLIDIDFTFLGMNLSLTPSFGYLNAYWFLPIISGAMAYVGMQITQKFSGNTTQEQNQQGKMFALMSPIMSVWFGFMWPAAMSVYWIANSLIGIVQDFLLNLYYKKKFDLRDAEKEKQEAAQAQAQAKKKAELSEKHSQDSKMTRSNLSNTSRKKYERLKKQSKQSYNQNKSNAAGEVDNADSDTADDAKGATDDD
ncbi:MAG: YidC/Oxa1 family membrane protein insertase [Eubacteriales bacterium]